MVFLDEAAVLRGLDIEGCRTVVRGAMIALSAGETRQLPRSIIPIAAGRLFGQMPGALLSYGYFGAKLISVFGDANYPGRSVHQGVVVLFDADSGRTICVADAGAITQIRTAAGTAAATDALAVPDAERLTIMGHGHQAAAHIEALALVRPLREVRVWGRSIARAQAFAQAMADKTGLSVVAVADAREAVTDAQIVTGARHPRGNPAWPKIGIFAQRGRNRPNRIGVTICRIVAVDGLNLEVEGLDAIDGTPVLDIKPVMSGFA